MTNPTSSVPVDPKGLEAYFTDVEPLRDYFHHTVAAPTPNRHLLSLTALVALVNLYCWPRSVCTASCS